MIQSRINKTKKELRKIGFTGVMQVSSSDGIIVAGRHNGRWVYFNIYGEIRDKPEYFIRSIRCH